MQLSSPFVQLPLSFDHNRLADEIRALGEEVWQEHPQKFPGNTMLPLIAIDGDPFNDHYKGCMRPTPALKRCPYLWQAMCSFGATMGRTRLMRLAGQAEVKRHVDQGYYWAERARIHVPIVTQPTVEFHCGDTVVNMAAGESWIFDTWRQHRVVNANDDMRIHLVIDTVGGEKFWSLVEAGRTHPPRHAQPDWRPRLVAFDPQAGLDPMLETNNVPDVMSPWEIGVHLGFLMAEGGNQPRMAAVHRVATCFVRDWRALWATYGDSGPGRAHYSRRLQAFIEDMREPAAGLILPNEIELYSAIRTLIEKFAVAEERSNQELERASASSDRG